MTKASGVVRRSVRVINERGLHARVAAKIAATAERFDADVRIACKGHEVSTLSIMGMLMLAAATGTRLELVARGSDAKSAVDALCTLFETGFEEI